MNKLFKLLFDYYFVLWVFSYFICIFVHFSPVLFMGLINIFLAIGFFISEVTKNNSIKKDGLIVLVFIGWLLLSFLLSTVLNGISVSFQSAIYVFSPLVLLFYGGKYGKCRTFWRNFIVGIVFNNVFGIICFYTKASFFVSYLENYSEYGLEQVMHHSGYGRLVTFFGCIETAILSAFGVIACLWFLITNCQKKVFAVISMIVNMSALILTQQRGPLFAVAFCLLFVLLYSLFKKRLIKIKYIFFLFLAIFGVMGILFIYKNTVFTWIIERISNPASAFEERYDYQFDILTQNSLIEWIIGRGVGSLGFFVENSTKQTRIFDQMYFNMIGEIGIIGSLLFLIICLKTIRPFLKNVRGLFGPFFIVMVVLIDGLGTTLSYYMPIMPIFWVSIGMLLINKEVKKVHTYIEKPVISKDNFCINNT